jgi:ABC-type antimicrobial peptide transport system permease subunit
MAAKAEPVAFVPASQNYHSSVTLYVRTKGHPAALVAPVKAAIQGLVPTLPLPWLGTIEGEIARSLWAPRMGAALLGVFGLLGLALSAVGLYGVTAYLVSRRTHEIGIRMAMGAAPGAVLKLILREGMMLLVPGLVIGAFAAHTLAGAVSSLLFGVKAADPPTYALAAAILTLTSLAAGFLPAWRAVHMPPYEALRRD